VWISKFHMEIPDYNMYVAIALLSISIGSYRHP